MNSQEQNGAEAQTTKVADTNSTNGTTSDIDMPIADIKREDTTSKTAATSLPAPLPTSPPTKPEPSPLPQHKHTSRSSELSSKRRTSRTRSPPPSTKRQRTSQSPSTSRNHQQPISSRSTRPDPGRRPAPPPIRAPDDKARNRRLFGGMLSTIAAKPNQRAARATPRPVDSSKREELEKRAAEREQKRLKEEDDARRERELRRREENKEKHIVWERNSVLVNADNRRLRAKFLRTSAKPELYYKPYVLTTAQKATISQQIEGTEVEIEKEIRAYEDTHPDQPPLPWKPLPPRKKAQDDMEDLSQVSPPVAVASPDAKMNDGATEDEPVSKVDGAQEKDSQKERERFKTDEFEEDEDVIETSEGGVSLIY